MTRAFAPIIEGNGGGTIVNILSVASWRSSPVLAVYCASKAAAWSLTSSLRLELAPRAVHVVGVHCCFVDTDLTAGIPGDKLSPGDVARATLAAIAADHDEVLVDEVSRESVPASLTRLLRSTRNSCRGSGAGRTQRRRRLAWSILEPCTFGTGGRVVPSPRRDRRQYGMEAIRPVWSSDRLAGRWWCSIAAPELEF